MIEQGPKQLAAYAPISITLGHPHLVDVKLGWLIRVDVMQGRSHAYYGLVVERNRQVMAQISEKFIC